MRIPIRVLRSLLIAYLLSQLTLQVGSVHPHSIYIGPKVPM